MTAVDRLLHMIAEGIERMSAEERRERLRVGREMVRQAQSQADVTAEIDAQWLADHLRKPEAEARG